MNWKTCEGCGSPALQDRAVTSTRRIGEADGVEYRHPECSDAWADAVAEDRAAMGIGPLDDPVSSPAHYRQLPSGIEVIEITENFDFLIGNVLKYVLRAEYKGKPLEDWKKARWYLDRAIEKRERDNGNSGR